MSTKKSSPKIIEILYSVLVVFLFLIMIFFIVVEDICEMIIKKIDNLIDKALNIC